MRDDHILDLAADVVKLPRSGQTLEIRILRHNEREHAQLLVKLDNGYGASIICGDGAYAGDRTYEVIYAKFTGDGWSWDDARKPGLAQSWQTSENILEVLRNMWY